MISFWNVTFFIFKDVSYRRFSRAILQLSNIHYLDMLEIIVHLLLRFYASINKLMEFDKYIIIKAVPSMLPGI